MARYAFHDLNLQVTGGELEAGFDLDRILDELSWDRTEASSGRPDLSLSVLLDEKGIRIPGESREVFRADGFRGLECGDEFHLTDGATHLRLEPRKGQCEARLAPSFILKAPLLRQNFWVFALLKLLRASGLYGLHAAGLVAEDGTGVLVVGPSGSGKSTVAIGLARRGWRYLSDDAVLLRSRSNGVEALALRRHFYVLSAEAGDYGDLPLGEERTDRCGGRRSRVGIEAACPSGRADACTPQVLLFSRVSREERSALFPLDRASALGQLIGQSSSQLFDRQTMGTHLATLNVLLQQAEAYELRAGLDLREDPTLLPRLLVDARGERPCLASS